MPKDKVFHNLSLFCNLRLCHRGHTNWGFSPKTLPSFWHLHYPHKVLWFFNNWLEYIYQRVSFLSWDQLQCKRPPESWTHRHMNTCRSNYTWPGARRAFCSESVCTQCTQLHTVAHSATVISTLLLLLKQPPQPNLGCEGELSLLLFSS